MRVVNVYGFGVHRKSQMAVGYQVGENLAVVAADPASAASDLLQLLGDDLASQSGPTVIVENALYNDGSATAPPPVIPSCTTAPYVSGTGTVGTILTSTMGTWTGEPTSYAYQWMSDGLTNLGSGAAYTIQPTDSGHTLTCIVTASNAAGSAASPPSNAVVVAASQKKG